MARATTSSGAIAAGLLHHGVRSAVTASVRSGNGPSHRPSTLSVVSAAYRYRSDSACPGGIVSVTSTRGSPAAAKAPRTSVDGVPHPVATSPSTTVIRSRAGKLLTREPPPVFESGRGDGIRRVAAGPGSVWGLRTRRRRPRYHAVQRDTTRRSLAATSPQPAGHAGDAAISRRPAG